MTKDDLHSMWVALDDMLLLNMEHVAGVNLRKSERTGAALLYLAGVAEPMSLNDAQAARLRQWFESHRLCGLPTESR